MVICGDFDENIEKQNPEERQDLENIEWGFPEGKRLPEEILSLYSIIQGRVVITDIEDEVMEAIKKSKYSKVSAHYTIKEELFIIYFEFAVESSKNEFKVLHFGIVPAQDFFNTIEDNNKIILRGEEFLITENRIKKILEKQDEFESKLKNPY